MNKVCSKCGLEKPTSEFYTWLGYKDGFCGRCKQCFLSYQKEYRSANHSRVLAVEKRSREEHRLELRDKGNKRRAELKIEVLTYYGGGKLACIKCSFSDMRALSIDHINDDGSEHRKIIKANHINEWLKKQGYPEGYQTLCMNCQFIKKSDLLRKQR